MNLLLATHFALAVMGRKVRERYPAFLDVLSDGRNSIHFSAVSLWEIAIKFRLGKLDHGLPLEEMAPTLGKLGVFLLGVTPTHAITSASPEPPTKDPFDRMLLAQATVEGMRLVTVDRALADHPVAFR